MSLTTLVFCLVSLRQGGAAGKLQVAKRLLDQKRYEEASQEFEVAAKAFAANGDPNAAQIWHEQSMHYHTEVRLFYEADPVPSGPRARLEPANGCFTGANIERDDVTRDPAEFNKTIGKNQAIFFIYRSYNREFPRDFAQKLRKLGAGLQVAWEPRSLSDVADNRYLHQFASDISKSGIPVFLRFASEMNGDWTPYHNDPVAYKGAFRLVADVMHREAPNAAMVWCPNTVPQANIDSYFPGDDAVDWVGVNFYSVLYNDGDRNRGASWKNPVDFVQYVYDRYSSKHPMMIGEWAATHRSVVDEKERPDFAIDKIGDFYSALPRIYPRIKAVHWLSMNTEAHAEGERRLNDFDLLDDPTVGLAYAQQTSPKYFRSYFTLDSDLADVQVPTPLAHSLVLKGQVRLSVWVRSYDAHPLVIFNIGPQRKIDGGRMTGAHQQTFDTTEFPDGPLQIKATVIDESGKTAGSQTLLVQIRNH